MNSNEENTIVEFTDKDSPHYIRTFANSVVFENSPFRDVILEFVEEYIVAPQVTRRILGDDGESEMTHHWNVVKVVREKKCSVTMSSENAIKLANLILQKLQGGDDYAN